MNPSHLPKKPTISDVAKLAGTGKTSISRYLNGEYNALSDKIKAKIEAAIKALDYRPNQMARSLKKGSTKLIAFILPDITNPYSVEVMQGLEATCQEHGYTLLVCNTNKDSDRETYYLQLLISYNVEGVVIHPSLDMSEQIAALPFPIVLIDRKMNNLDVDRVGLDNAQSSTLAANHLIECGFDAVLFLTEPVNDVSTRIERMTTFKTVFEKKPNTYFELVELSTKNQTEIQTELEHHIDRFNKTHSKMRKAIVTINGFVTLNAVLAMKTLNIKLGQDVGFLGFDDPKWAAVVGTGITTIRQPTYQIGCAAFKLLHKRITGNHPKSKQVLFCGELIIRSSTAPCYQAEMSRHQTD